MDLEKAFDGVNRNLLGKILNKSGVTYNLIDVIKSLYKNSGVQIDTERKLLDKIYISQGIRQGVIYRRHFYHLYRRPPKEMETKPRRWYNALK